MSIPHQKFSVAIIIHKAYDFYLSLHASIIVFPKTERYVLGQKCEELSLDFMILLLRANQVKNYNRSKILFEASDKLDLLKILIRASKDVRALPEKKYLEIETAIQEIGRMLGGWIKSLKH